jgi:hypothetical protein
MNIKASNNMKLNQGSKKNYINNYLGKQKKISFSKVDKCNKKILKKLKTVSPFGNNYNSRNNKKMQENSNISNNKKNSYFWNNKRKKKSIQNNKSLDNQKIFFKKKKIKDTSVNTKNVITKTKNKILSRNVGSNNMSNNLVKNNTNIKLNTKDIFNSKLNNLTITNINKIKDQLSRNIFNNLNSFTGKSKKGSIMNNTNSYLNNHDYPKILSNKTKEIYFTNNNNNYIKKGINLKGSKSKNNIYLKNSLFNRPVKKLNKKKN